MRGAALVAFGAVLMVLWTAQVASANEQSKRLVSDASVRLYNLDLEQAEQLFRDAVAADPNDSAAYRGLATALWAQIAYRRGAITIDSFFGRVSGPSVKTAPVPPALAVAFRDAVESGATLARARLDRQPNNVDAIYEYGASVGLRASYAATIDGRVLGAFRSARAAFDAHERVLALDPNRHDAGLIVGMYRYLVSALSMPMRVMAYAVGFGGDARRGLQLVEGAANHAGDGQTDARLALVLMYSRERRFDDALAVLAMLRERYPANRLFWLEAGSTLLRAQRPADAERLLTEGLGRFKDDRRPRMFGEEAIWFYRLGSARLALKRASEASADFRRALTLEGRGWVHGRAQLKLGKLARAAGRSDEARTALQQAVMLCESDYDPRTADEARRLLKR
jgi:tetratricopeptide (TPR) repeat protein